LKEKVKDGVAVIDEEKYSKETQLALKNDYSLDYTKSDNVFNKLKELADLRLKTKYDPKYH
jgi:hypothetical protein